VSVGACWAQGTVAFFERLADGDVGGKPESKVSSQERSKREIVVWRMRAIAGDQSVGDRLDFGGHGRGVVVFTSGKRSVGVRSVRMLIEISMLLSINAKTAEESRRRSRDVRHAIGH